MLSNITKEVGMDDAKYDTYVAMDAVEYYQEVGNDAVK